MVDNGKTGISSGNCEELAADEDGDRSVTLVEDPLRKEMTVNEKFITRMLTNFGSMALDRIHNTLKMFCIADPTYDKSLQQLQSFLSGVVVEESMHWILVMIWESEIFILNPLPHPTRFPDLEAALAGAVRHYTMEEIDEPRCETLTHIQDFL